MAKIYPMVVDLSHWDPASSYEKVAASGIVGVIYKATEGTGYTDPTYVQQQKAAKAAGLCWGSYHFADASDVNKQIDNYLRFACPDPDELFCLDWEDNPSGGGKMTLANVKTWISAVEGALNRPNQCVLYGGNTIKEALGSEVDEFLFSRRLWLCQYGSTPTWPPTWDSYWLWQFTDGEVGPTPHSVDGIGPCDINSYDRGPEEQLIAEWASGTAQPVPPEPSVEAVNVLISAPADVRVIVRQVQQHNVTRERLNRQNEAK